jgi:hypothetical protein
MSESDDPGCGEPSDMPPAAFQPGEHVLVWVMGTWLPGVVVDTDAGDVITRYRRLDGELEDRVFSSSSVMQTNRH